jgi:chromosome segregation ATPase
MCSGRRLALALLLVLWLSWPLPAQSSDSPPTSQAELSELLIALSESYETTINELEQQLQNSSSTISEQARLLTKASKELEKAQTQQRRAEKAFARVVTSLNEAERSQRNSSASIAQLRSQLDDSESSLKRLERQVTQLRRRMWIERVVITVVAGAIGYATAEIVDAVK